MRQQSDGSRYYFRANATAFGGRIYRPVPEILETHGATSLPITGGYASARSEKFAHRELFRFDAAWSQASGSRSLDGSTFDTLITATVENLNIAGMVTADRVVARLSAEHPNRDGALPDITLIGSHFVNLRIAGCQVIYDTYAGLLGELCSYDRLQDRYQKDPKSLAQFGKDANWEKLPKEARSDSKRVPEIKGIIPCSLFTNIRCAEGQWTAEGNAITIPQFGTIYLGEVLISRTSRRLTMIRAELGCPLQADASSGSVEGDGYRIP